jgi:hypothetical protein
MRRNNDVLKGESDAVFAMAAALANILIFILVAATLWLVHVLFTNLFRLEAVARSLEGI